MSLKRPASSEGNRHMDGADVANKTMRTQAALSLAQKPRTVPSVLYLSIDYGTKNLPVAYRLGEPTDNIYDTHMVSYGYDSRGAPQKVGWKADSSFLWGYHVDDALRVGDIQWKDVVELWKLALYKDSKTDPIACRVAKQLKELGKGTVSDLIRTHLQAVLHETREWIRKREWARSHGTVDVRSLPIRLFLNVPQVWSPLANRIMVEAARGAGVDWVEVVYEAQSAIGYYVAFLKSNRPGALEPGDDVLISDLGGGTGDFGVHKLPEGSDGGATATLQCLSKLKGEFCGSQFVNDNFLTWLKNLDVFEKKRHELCLTELEIEKAASQQFDRLKHDFHGPNSTPPTLVIQQGPGSRARPWVVYMENSDMASFFQPVIEKIFECIDSLITADTKEIFVAGGFGRSVYLRKAMEARYSGVVAVFGQDRADQNLEHPVARGALVRFKTIGARGLEASVAFGIARSETYEAEPDEIPQPHPDATYKTGDLMLDGKINSGPPRANKAIVSVDPYDKRQIVYDRWLPLLQKGATVSAGSEHTNARWQYYIVRPDQRTISEQIYCADIDLKEHASIARGKTIETSGLVEGVSEWGPLLPLDLPDLRKAGFKLKRFVGNKKWYYEVFARVKVRCHGANVGFGWEIASPDTPPYDSDGKESTLPVAVLTVSDDYELCREAFSPFARTSAA